MKILRDNHINNNAKIDLSHTMATLASTYHHSPLTSSIKFIGSLGSLPLGGVFTPLPILGLPNPLLSRFYIDNKSTLQLNSFVGDVFTTMNTDDINADMDSMILARHPKFKNLPMDQRIIKYYSQPNLDNKRKDLFWSLYSTNKAQAQDKAITEIVTSLLTLGGLSLVAYAKITGDFKNATGNIDKLDAELFDGKLKERLKTGRGYYFDPYPPKNKHNSAKNKNSVLTNTIIADSPFFKQLISKGNKTKTSKPKSLPKVGFPKLSLPKINLPKFNPPKISLPKLFPKPAPSKKKEKIMKKFLITLISLVLLFKIGFEIHHNLVYYSVYYAQHLNHHKDTDPVMALLIDNLHDIPRLENDQIGYDFDGINTIYHNYKNIQIGGLISNYDLYRNRNVYSFYTSGKFHEYTIMGSEIPYDFKEKQKEAKKLVYDIIQPIIDIQPKPPKYANLQWLFNITYGRRFQ